MRQVSKRSCDEPEEAQTKSFVVRLWGEGGADARGRTLWRGHITHVPSGRRQYVQSLSEITDFIAPYVEGMPEHRSMWRAIARRLRGRGGTSVVAG